MGYTQDGCASHGDWPGAVTECKEKTLSVRMVRFVVGARRCAFVVVRDGSPIQWDGPPEFDVQLWVNRSLVIRKRDHVAPPWFGGVVGQSAFYSGFRGAFLDRLDDTFPTLPGLDDDAATRFLRGLVLASDPQSEEWTPNGRATQEDTRRVVRVRRELFQQDAAAAGPVSIATTVAWVDDAGAWDVTTDFQETSNFPRPRVGGRVGMIRRAAGAIEGEEHFTGWSMEDALRRRVSTIEACYRRALRRNPEADGIVTVEFTVEGHRVVRGARVIENAASNQELPVCVTREVTRLRWHPDSEGDSGTYAYSFSFAP